MTMRDDVATALDLPAARVQVTLPAESRGGVHDHGDRVGTPCPSGLAFYGLRRLAPAME